MLRLSILFCSKVHSFTSSVLQFSRKCALLRQTILSLIVCIREIKSSLFIIFHLQKKSKLRPATTEWIKS